MRRITSTTFSFQERAVPSKIEMDSFIEAAAKVEKATGKPYTLDCMRKTKDARFVGFKYQEHPNYVGVYAPSSDLHIGSIYVVTDGKHTYAFAPWSDEEKIAIPKDAKIALVEGIFSLFDTLEAHKMNFRAVKLFNKPAEHYIQLVKTSNVRSTSNDEMVSILKGGK